jgi:phosphotriesterase-related protein
MPTVETALGPVDAAQLGFTLSHEHVMTSAGEDTKHYPWLYDLDRSLERAIANLREVKAGGVDTIIDLTTPDLARDVRFIEAASRASGMQVVVATGIWRDPPRSFLTRDIDASADIFVREIEVGIDDTSIKAGVIKVANDEEGIGPAHVNVLRAAARASARTGCPISTHHWAKGEQGREQLRIFLEEGAPVDRICIGHSADTTDVDYLVSLLEAGVWLSMDRYPGRPGRPGWEERNATVKALVDRGWAHRIMLGHDASATRPVPAGMTEPPSDGYNPDGMLHLTRTALPALLASGVSQPDIDTMMRDVPRRFLAGEG